MKLGVLCAGLSRSAAVVVAYVMESLRMPFVEAIQHVQSKRCCIHISEALHNQLREFETIYQNRQARTNFSFLFFSFLFFTFFVGFAKRFRCFLSCAFLFESSTRLFVRVAR